MIREYELQYWSIPRAEQNARGLVKRDFPFSIEHSGCRFTTDVIDWRRASYVWPIEELLARKDYPPAQAQRIRKLNPYGKTEGEICPLFEARP